MTKSKLPDFFQKYLDEKFSNVDGRFDEMHNEIGVLRDEIGSIKLTSVIVGAIGGLLAAIATFFGYNQFRK